MPIEFSPGKVRVPYLSTKLWHCQQCGWEVAFSPSDKPRVVDDPRDGLSVVVPCKWESGTRCYLYPKRDLTADEVHEVLGDT